MVFMMRNSSINLCYIDSNSNVWSLISFIEKHLLRVLLLTELLVPHLSIWDVVIKHLFLAADQLFLLKYLENNLSVVFLI